MSNSVFKIVANSAVGASFLWFLTCNSEIFKPPLAFFNDGKFISREVATQVVQYLDYNTKVLLPQPLLEEKDIQISGQNFDWRVKNFPDLLSKLLMLAVIFGTVPVFESLRGGLATGGKRGFEDATTLTAFLVKKLFPEKKKS